MRLFLLIILTILIQARQISAQSWTSVSPGGETQCALGTPYSFFHRDGPDADRLLIYFQGGGACWNWVSCSGTFDGRVDADEVSPFRGIFDQANAENPFKEFPVVFVPYCTADVHVGDAERRYGDDRSNPIAHRGYRNVSAVLDWIAKQNRRPRTVVVAGTSAGAYGALFYIPHIQRLFPDATVVMLADSGVPLLSDNRQVFELWGTQKLFGSEVSLLGAYQRAAASGPRVRLAHITSDQDSIQSAFYIISGSPRWRDATYTLLRDVRSAIPSFRTFIVGGADHGLLPTNAFYAYAAGNTSLKDWVSRLIRNEPVDDARCAACVVK